MKKLYIILMGLAIPAMVLSQEVTINGTADFKEAPTKIYLYYSNAGSRMSDSTLLKNGKFTFTANLTEPTLASIIAKFPKKSNEKRPRTDGLRIYLEPGVVTVKVTDTLANAIVSGSKVNKEFKKIVEGIAAYRIQKDKLSKKYMEYRKEKDKAGMDSVVAMFDKIDEQINESVYHQFFRDNPNSPVALYALERYVGYDINPVKVEPMFKSLSEKVRQSPSGIAYNKRIEKAKETSVGAIALDFTQNDTLGNPVSLSDFRGKYVLLDFWASWCGPCRAENPNVVEAFNKYKNDNFTVLGVSLDREGQKDVWLEAIHKDKLTWTQVSDLQFWDNAVARKYGIRAIPQNFLIDPTGKIIAKNIRGEELQNKLAEEFKGK